MAVHTAMLGDWMVDLSPKVAYLLENGVKGLVYSGDVDFICNWRGGEAWTNALEWAHKDEFNKS
jgi:carboxypeptidase C (cathepsin A)